MSEPESFCARVLGPPAFYGNKKAMCHRTTGKVVLFERKDGRTRSWQDTLRAACAENAPPSPLNEPVKVHITVLMARPAGHFGTGRNAGVLKDSAPLWAGVKPDIDKIARCVLDCLTGTWIIDDARVTELYVTKFYAGRGYAEETRVWMQRTALPPVVLARREPGAGG